jgi:hypothetical protein
MQLCWLATAMATIVDWRDMMIGAGPRRIRSEDLGTRQRELDLAEGPLLLGRGRFRCGWLEEAWGSGAF